MNQKLSYRKRILLYLLLLIFLWICFALNYENADTYSYKLIYSGVYKTEPLFAMICAFFYNNGFAYHIFVIFCATSTLLIFAFTLYQYTRTPFGVLLLFFIYPFFYYVVGLRNALGFSLVFFATRYLIRKGPINIIKYIIFIGVATLIQNSLFFYIVLLLVKIKQPNKNFLKLLLSFLFISILVFNFGLLPLFLNMLDKSSRLYKRLAQKSLAGFTISTILQMFCVLHSTLIFNKCSKYIDDIKDYRILDSISKYVYISAFLIIFYIHDSIFYRLNYNMLIFSYILMDIVYTNPKIYWKGKEKYLYIGLSAGLILTHVLYYSILGNYQLLAKQIFFNNYFFDFLFLKWRVINERRYI